MDKFKKHQQTYQDLYEVVRNEFPKIIGDPQEYFFQLKKLHPSKYERMGFDINGHTPYSSELSEILSTIRTYEYKQLPILKRDTDIFNTTLINIITSYNTGNILETKESIDDNGNLNINIIIRK